MRNYKEQTEKILELVEQKKKTQEKRKNIVVTFSSLAACAVIALLCTSLFSGGGHKAIPINEQNLTSQTVTINSEKTHKMKSSKKDKKDKTNATNPKTTCWVSIPKRSPAGAPSARRSHGRWPKEHAASPEPTMPSQPPASQVLRAVRNRNPSARSGWP